MADGYKTDLTQTDQTPSVRRKTSSKEPDKENKTPPRTPIVTRTRDKATITTTQIENSQRRTKEITRDAPSKRHAVSKKRERREITQATTVIGSKEKIPEQSKRHGVAGSGGSGRKEKGVRLVSPEAKDGNNVKSSAKAPNLLTSREKSNAHTYLARSKCSGASGRRRVEKDTRARGVSVSQRMAISRRGNASDTIVQRTQSASAEYGVFRPPQARRTATPIEYNPKTDNFDYLKFLDMHYVDVGPGVKTITYREKDLLHVIRAATWRFKEEKMLIDTMAPAIIVGDIHGQFNDLVSIFLVMGRPPAKKYVFLGDYVDRGAMAVECAALLFGYKAKYPDHIFLLKGNHENARTNRKYGFQQVCHNRTDLDGIKLWAAMQRAFNYLSVAALVSDKILCVHGGITPHLTSFDVLRQHPKPVRNPYQGLCSDMVWSDPDTAYDFWRPNSRGCGFFFGRRTTEDFCERFGIDMIVRGHQVCLEGYSTLWDKRVVTIFSAPCYTNDYKNAGCVLKVAANLECELVALVPDYPGSFAGCQERLEISKRLWDPSLEVFPESGEPPKPIIR